MSRQISQKRKHYSQNPQEAKGHDTARVRVQECVGKWQG